MVKSSPVTLSVSISSLTRPTSGEFTWALTTPPVISSLTVPFCVALDKRRARSIAARKSEVLKVRTLVNSVGIKRSVSG